MTGREEKAANDIFFVCSLIDYISRKTLNTRRDVVDALGRKGIEKMYELADIYHSDNIEDVSDQFIAAAGILKGTFDNVGECGYSIPSHWDIGKVYTSDTWDCKGEEGICHRCIIFSVPFICKREN